MCYDSLAIQAWCVTLLHSLNAREGMRKMLSQYKSSTGGLGDVVSTGGGDSE